MDSQMTENWFLQNWFLNSSFEGVSKTAVNVWLFMPALGNFFLLD